MNRKSILKIGMVILMVAVIFMQAYRIQASSGGLSFSDLAGNEIADENGVTSGLNMANNVAGNNVTGNNTAGNNVVGNNTANTAKNTTNNTANTEKNTTNNTANKNTTLPQTGTNENIIIGLMIIFVGVGVYTFKKVRDYNI